jgi:hypothetical protein
VGCPDPERRRLVIIADGGWELSLKKCALAMPPSDCDSFASRSSAFWNIGMASSSTYAPIPWIPMRSLARGYRAGCASRVQSL